MRRDPRSSAATRPRPGAGCARVRAPLTRSGAAALPPAPPLSSTGPGRRPAPARANRPRRRPRAGRALSPARRRPASRSVAAAMEAFVPSGEPPSTTARTPSWCSTARASERMSSGSTASRRATTTPEVDAASAASAAASAALACWRSRPSSRSASRWRSMTRVMPASRSSGSVRSSSAASWTRCSRSTARAREGLPVRAKIRRVFDPMEPSETRLIGPMRPSPATWVPPQNSSESGPACTTRTESPYLSPKKAMAPMRSASSREVSVVSTGSSPRTSSLATLEHRDELLPARLGVVREVEAQAVRRDQRALLADVVAEHLAQRGVQQVRRGVVAPDRLAALAVDGGQRVLARARPRR